VYETVCELNANQNNIEQRLGELEEKLNNIQVKIVYFNTEYGCA